LTHLAEGKIGRACERIIAQSRREAGAKDARVVSADFAFQPAFLDKS
jgi:hypothetical protein